MWGVTADQLRLAMSCQRRQNELQAVQPQHGQRRAGTKRLPPTEPKDRDTADPEFRNPRRSKGPLSRKIWCCSPLSFTPNPRLGGRFKPHVLPPFGLT